ncbi:hypothetical protein FJT64_006379 [Amphibalanus amphitrite]|uniref:CHK kinase-like domain-containing protein n=1 Tax=Amphibalanus amphitrite TaxID=1232801 RepID=A0A6A4VNJ7_AMPAM|nr:hypothetical protein FJT64_006379 [Amphibalanus amphitrite]
MALPIPSGPDDVTDEWLEQLLRRYHGDEYRLSSVTPTSIEANQVSYCSEMRVLDCTGHLGSRSLTDHILVKLLPKEANIRALVTQLKLVQCETNVYKDLLPELCQFERSRGRSAVASMIVRCLCAEIDDSGHPDGLRYVIVLENLQPAGFSTPEPLNLPENALPEAVRQLAQLAATSNAWLRNCSLQDPPYVLTTRLPKDHPTSQLIRIGVQNVEPGLRRQNRLKLLEKLHRVEERATELISAGLQPREPKLRVVTHGDYRDGNLLLRRVEGGENGEENGEGPDEGSRSDRGARWEVRVVDWQATMVAHPAVDLIYLLMLSVPRSVMKRVEERVLDIYWEGFSASCGALGADCPLTRRQLTEDFRQAKLLGLMWCLCMVTLWGKQPLWPDHCIDVAVEVEELGLLEGL